MRSPFVCTAKVSVAGSREAKSCLGTFMGCCIHISWAQSCCNPFSLGLTFILVSPFFGAELLPVLQACSGASSEGLRCPVGAPPCVCKAEDTHDDPGRCGATFSCGFDWLHPFSGHDYLGWGFLLPWGLKPMAPCQHAPGPRTSALLKLPRGPHASALHIVETQRWKVRGKWLSNCDGVACGAEDCKITLTCFS